MGGQTKKLIAPIIITVLLVTYLVASLVTWVFTPVHLALKVIGILVPLALVGVCIYVLIERIKEIRCGEEDDLSKY